MNWRSRREIVNFNNDFWDPENISRIAAENDFQQAIRKNFKDSKQDIPAGEERKGGYVELSLHVEAEDRRRGRLRGSGTIRGRTAL